MKSNVRGGGSLGSRVGVCAGGAGHCLECVQCVRASEGQGKLCLRVQVVQVPGSAGHA